MFTWLKGENPRLSQYFEGREFACRCGYNTCRTQTVSKELIAKLDAVRSEYGHPIVVTSGCRCRRHQVDLALGGVQTAKGKSTHELGWAADIRGSDMNVLLPILERHFEAIGIARTFYHVDLRVGKKRRWNYV